MFYEKFHGTDNKNYPIPVFAHNAFELDSYQDEKNSYYPLPVPYNAFKLEIRAEGNNKIVISLCRM